MNFMLDELIGHPVKKRKGQKRKKDGSKAKAKKKGTAMAEEALASLKGIAKEVLRLATPELGVAIPAKETDSDGHRGGEDGLGACIACTSHCRRGGDAGA